MKSITYIVLAILCGGLVSCTKWGNRENSRLIEQAQQLIEQIPDSALTLLDAANTFKFNDAERAEYILLRVQARSNAGMDLTTDDEIFDAREYLIRRKDPEKAALACFYAALVATYKNQATIALEYYHKALDFVKNTDNKVLQGKICYNMGYLNYKSRLFDDAISHYQHALKIFQTMNGQYLREVYSLNEIANSLMLKHQTDSAQYYYQQALDVAYLHEDTTLLVMVYNNIGVVYMEMNQLDTAIFYYRQALRKSTTDDDRAYLYKNLTFAFYDQNNLDSARYYLKKTEPLVHNVDNIFFSASWINLLYQIEKADGNTSKALEYFELYSKYQVEILEKNDRKLLLEMQKKYDMTAKENLYNREINRWWKIAWELLFGLLTLAVFSAGVFYKSMKRKTALAKIQQEMNEKELDLAKAKQEKAEQILELEKAEQRAYTLQELYHQKDNEMKTKFLERIGIIKRIALLTPYLKEDVRKTRNDEEMLIMKTLDIVRTLNVQKFIDTANELYPGFTYRLKQFCRKLDDREICICCLILFDFNNKELDAFLNNRLKGTLSSIQNWKSAIRKKMNITPMGDIKEFLLEKIIHDQ